MLSTGLTLYSHDPYVMQLQFCVWPRTRALITIRKHFVNLVQESNGGDQE